MAVQPYIGVLTGPARVTAAAVSGRSAPGLLAVSVAALISIAAWSGRALFADMGTTMFLTGVIVPLVLVAGVAIAQRLQPAPGDDAVWEFTVRTDKGSVHHHSLRTGARRDALRPGDLLRVSPARHATLFRRTADRRSPARAVEILATPAGPVIDRLNATSALPTPQRAGLALAVLLLAATVISFLTA
ncbi:hypothetical protein [Actinoplanes sp. G11-F43]|uniref:hypothetical protein n=1 Tax=Actinoplanes sp. G11-F43 TaxID=3424130 RepID=UPI003D3399DE